MTQARIIGNLGDSLSGSSNTDISFDSNTLYIDAVNNRVGFGTTTPTQKVDIVGSANVSGTLVAGVIQNTTIKNYYETVNVLGNTSTTITLDLNTATTFSATLNANCTFSFANPPRSGNVGNILLILTNNHVSNTTVTWPNTVIWTGGITPPKTTTNNAVDIWSFFTVNGGNTWIGTLAAADLR